MRLLLDECVTHDLKRDLIGHSVATAVEAGFGGLENGELLRAASAKFDALITVDRRLPHQQNLQNLNIAVLVIEGRGISYEALKPLIPKVLAALARAKAGETIRIR